ncbi:MAG: O-antigen ligase family protein [Phycisphaerales bacterium]|nr:O-antigen ligase family protein [Phycisphaerales bacterium]
MTREGFGHALRWGALGGICFAALVRASLTTANIPYWDVDPTQVLLPETTLTPAWGLALDTLVWLSAAAAVLGETRVGRTVMWRTGLLILVGYIGVALHGKVLEYLPGVPGNARDLWKGSSWLAGFVGAWGLAHLARDRTLLRAGAAILLGYAAMLAAKAAFQTFVDQPRTIRAFEADPAGSLIAQGIDPGGTEAREFERRLRSPGAIGWFGLSNMVGTFAAGATVTWLLLALLAWGRPRDGRGEGEDRFSPAMVATLMFAASAAMLVMSRSRGAMAAAAVGGGAVLWWAWPRVRGVAARFGPLLMLGLPGAALLAVVVRGLVGERIGELSLLFRWHYLVAAVRIIRDHPLLGVGPDGFQSAYLLAKVPINPEQVQSPHSIVFDYVATLGVCGAALMLLAAIWMLWLGRSLRGADAGGEEPTDERGERAARMVTLAVLAGVFGLVCWREQPTLGTDEWGFRIVGLLLSVAGAWGLLALGRGVEAAVGPGRLACASALGGLAMMTHAQIEVTPAMSSGVGWFFAWIGLAAGWSVRGRAVAAVSDEGNEPRLPPRFPGLAAAALLAAGAADVSMFALRPAWMWERRLAEAAAIAHELSTRPASGEGAFEAGVVERAWNRLEEARSQIGSVWEPAELKYRLYLMVFARLDVILPWVDTAVDIHFPRDFVDADIRRAQWSAFEESMSQMPTVVVRQVAQRFEAIAASASIGDRLPNGGASSSAGRLGDIESLREDARRQATRWYNRAMELDPYSLSIPLRLIRISQQLKEPPRREWVLRALENNALLRLDPLKQLSQAEEQALRRMLE